MSGSTISGNNGLITIGAGNSPINLPGPIVGTGTVLIDPGGVLETGYSIAAGISLEFAPGYSGIFERDQLGGGGVAVLSDPTGFLGTIDGFGPGDQLAVVPASGQTIASAVINGTSLDLLAPGGSIVDAFNFAYGAITSGDSLVVIPATALAGLNFGTLASNEVIVSAVQSSPTVTTTPTLQVVAGSPTTIPQLIANDAAIALAGAQFTLTLSSSGGTFSEGISLPAYVSALQSDQVALGPGDGAFDAGAVSINGTTVSLGGYAAGSTLSVSGSGTGTLVLTSDNLTLLNLQAALVTYTAAAGSSTAAITTTFSDGTNTTTGSIVVQAPSGGANLVWQATSGGTFSTATNWSGAGGTISPGAPDVLTFGAGGYNVVGDGVARSITVTGDPAFEEGIDIANAGSTALLVQGGGDAGFTGLLLAQGDVLGGVSGSGEIDLFGPASDITGNVTIGVQSAGVLAVSGLLDVTGNLDLGVGGLATVNEAAATGTSLFARSGTDILAANVFIGVGAGQTAIFNDAGGSLAATGVIAIATSGGSQGALLLSAGTVSAASLVVGSAGTLSNSGAGASTVSVSSLLLNEGSIDSLGGDLGIAGAVDNQGVILAQGGTISLPSVIASSNSGLLIAGTGGELDLGNVSAAQTIDLAQNGTLLIEQPNNGFAAHINMLASTATILVGSPGANVQITGESYANGTLDVAFSESGGTQTGTLALAISGLGPSPRFSVPASNTLVLPCFATGTRIDTDAGEVPVETLRVGTLVCTADGERRRVVWIGHREVDCRRHPQAGRIYPVRVARGAFGEGLPWRDLYLSPDHAVFVDGVLIPVRYLVNGRSILQVAVAKIGYWHVELDRHDVLLAEGLPVESYLDTGNRANFANGGDHLRLYPDFAPLTWSDACADLVVSGPVVNAVKRRLFFRCGLETGRPRGELEVLVGRRHIAPEIIGTGVWRCALPRGTRRVVLSSPTWMPAAHVADSLDQRQLGVKIFGIEADGVPVALGSPTFSRGFYPVEVREEGRFRWTMGEAEWTVPAGTRVMKLHLADDPAVSARSMARRNVR